MEWNWGFLAGQNSTSFYWREKKNRGTDYPNTSARDKVSELAVVWLRFHLGLFSGRYCYSFGPSGRTLGLERWLRKVGSDRLNATERPLVLLVVDVVFFCY